MPSNVLQRHEDRLSSRTGRRSDFSAISTSAQEASGRSGSSSIIQRRKREPIDIRYPDYVYGVAFLVDGEHVVSGDTGEKIRCWRVEDGSEVGAPMDAGSIIRSIAVSRDGKWIISGTDSGMVQAWNAKTGENVREIPAHNEAVCAVDVSPDSTKIATGSKDQTASVWSLSTGKRLLGPWEHDCHVVAAKFSPDGRLAATATWTRDSVRVYDGGGGGLFSAAIRVNSYRNNSLAWSSDSKRLFVLSRDAWIHCIDASTGEILSRWVVHGTDSSYPTQCVAVASNGTFVAASARWSVSFWDTTTLQQIGSIVRFDRPVYCLVISDDLNLAVSGEKVLFLRNLEDILPPPYLVNTQDIAKIRTQLSETEENAQLVGGDMLVDAQEIAGATGAPPENFRERCEHVDAQREQNERPHDDILHLRETIETLRHDLAESQRAIEEERGQSELLRAWQMKANNEIRQLKHQISENQGRYEKENEALRSQFEQWKNSVQRVAEEQYELLRDENVNLTRAVQEHQCAIRVHEQKHQYEALYAQRQTFDAAEFLLEIRNSEGEYIRGNKFLSDWLSESTSRCIGTLEKNGDDASNAGKPGEAATAYAAAVSLGSSAPDAVLAKWANAALTNTSLHQALCAGIQLKAPGWAIYRAICNSLDTIGRLSEAVKMFRQMQNDLQDTDTNDEQIQWEREFRERCAEKLVNLGDTARDNKKHEEAIRYYSDAISLDPTNCHDVLLKRATELIELDPSSYNGYGEKHTALNSMGRYSEAFEAFKEMLSIFDCSHNPEIRELRHQYIDATSVIRKEIKEVVRHLPTVLIDTDTGRLYDKTRQAIAFEELPIYDELRSSMTTALDHPRIEREVSNFYRYVMFSHKWQLGEPTFQQVEHDSVYNLPSSPTFDKLRNFCKLVVTLQFKWAWSDTCCVNQLNKEVQQESIFAMFRWYRRSSLTVVHLLGVLSVSQEAGCLWRSIWNTRGWTYQEYVASEVVQFYTEDWKPYLGLEIFNHKESPTVLSEMERATNITTQQLIILQPGLDRPREKLYLASGRHTEREEDMAYSLFGIFGVALPIMYGEGNLAVGRLLEHILTRSAEVTLLAWTGHAGDHHTYLPASLMVYSEIMPPHVPALIETSEMAQIVSALRPDLSPVVDLYRRLYDLPPLSVAAGRLRLPGLVFQLDGLSPASGPGPDPEPTIYVYRTTTALLGDVEIKTTADLSEMTGLCLIHPWIGPLIDQDFSRGVPQFDLRVRALRLLVRLRQPFGGLLLALSAREQYKRVATDSLIMARIQEGASLSGLTDAIRTVNIQ